MNLHRSLSLLAVAALTVPALHATTYINDVFSSGNYTTGALLGQDTPSWIQVSSTVNPIQVTGGNVVLVGTGQDLQQAFSGNVATTSGNSLYTTAQIDVTSAGASPDYFFHLGLAGNTSLFFQRLFVKAGSSAGTFDFGILPFSGNGSNLPVYGADLSLNTVYDVVIAWDFVTGGNNDINTIYVNPTDVRANDAAYATTSWSVTTSAEPTSVSAIDFRQGSTGPGVNVLSLNVSDTFPVTSSVPEPAVYAAFFGTGALGLASWYRRRRF